MKKLLIALLLASSLPAMASSYSRQVSAVTNAISNGISSLREQMKTPQGAQSIYMTVGRSNDVFLFCKQGIPKDSWIGVNPTNGSYQILDYWSVNPQWIPYYVVVCPYGGKAPGNWTGKGDGSTVPFTH